MKTYYGRTDGTVLVQDAERTYPLNPRLDLVKHSPSGFGWGYGGSGAAQLALALLADLLGDDTRALALYQEFKWRVIARLPYGQPWGLTSREALAALESITQEVK